MSEGGRETRMRGHILAPLLHLDTGATTCTCTHRQTHSVKKKRFKKMILGEKRFKKMILGCYHMYNLYMHI